MFSPRSWRSPRFFLSSRARRCRPSGRGPRRWHGGRPVACRPSHARALAKLDRDRVALHAQTLAELKKERKALETRGAEFNTLHAAAEKAQAAAQRAAQAKTDLIRDIDKRRDLNAQLSSELQAAQQKLQGTLHDLATGAPAAAAQLPFRPFRGALDWPMDGSVVRRFGRGSASNGIEIAAVE